jgi:hypothetical protein
MSDPNATARPCGSNGCQKPVRFYNPRVRFCYRHHVQFDDNRQCATPGCEKMILASHGSAHCLEHGGAR